MKNLISVSASAGLLIASAAAVSYLPLRWSLSCFGAAAFHELCHILAVYICKGSITSISFRLWGAQIHAGRLSYGGECISALAGPLGGLLLLFFYDMAPELSLCAAVQSAVNLLPFYPLDGGRALYCGLQLFFSDKITEFKWRKIQRFLELSIIFLIMILLIFRICT